jgi:hypothetical protein
MNENYNTLVRTANCPTSDLNQDEYKLAVSAKPVGSASYTQQQHTLQK